MSSYQRYPNEREVRPYGDEEADFTGESNREFGRESSTNRSGRYRGRERGRERDRGSWEREGRGMRGQGEYGREGWEREGRHGSPRGSESAQERESFGGYEGARGWEGAYEREGGYGSRGFAGGYGQHGYGSRGWEGAYGREGGYGAREREYGARGHEGYRGREGGYDSRADEGAFGGWSAGMGASASDMRGFEGRYGSDRSGSYDDRYGPRGYESWQRPWSERERETGSQRYESAGFGGGPEGIYGMQRGYEQGQDSWGQGAGSWGRGSYAGVGPRGYQRSDERVREDVCDRLERDARIDASDIEVEVHNGMVTLKGSVDDRNVKRQAEEAIESLPGVKDVQNQIRVEKRQTFGRASETKEAQSSGTSSRETGRETKERKTPTTAM